MTDEILVTQGLTKKYNQQYALKDVNLTIRQGEIYGLIGRNGAGKTTLLKAITGLITPDKGEIQLFGSENHKEQIKNLKRSGSVIETPVAYEQLTAQENLTYYCRLRGIVQEKELVEETLRIVGLTNTGKKKFKNFSLGMKQKLGIALAILSRPDFLIIDEPINGLDPIAIVDFRQMLQRLNEELGMTIIISSHILTELYHVATRFGIINNGQLIKEFTKNEFEHSSKDYIILKTPKIEEAMIVIQEQFAYPTKAVAEDELRIFGHFQHISSLAVAFVENQVPIESLYYQKQDLEKYFTDLLEDTGEVQSND